MSGLRDLFDTNEDGTYKSHLGSGGEALLEEANRQYNEDNPQEEDGTYDSSGLDRNDGMMMSGGGGSGMFSERVLDRMIKIRGVPKVDPRTQKSLAMWSEAEFLEQLVLNSLTKLEQKKILRKWRDIRDLAESEGSEEMMRAHAEALMIETLMHRSDVENEGVPNERSQWNTNTSVQKQVSMNRRSGGSASSSVLQRLFGR
jgi:hypothetical protein